MNTIRHLGVIMDGNRRWAKNNGLEPQRGHDQGSEIFGKTGEWCIENRISYLTVYAFSTENWKRSDSEVSHIFGLLVKYFTEKKETCIKEGIRIRVIGERGRFDKSVLSVIDEIEKITSGGDKLNVQIALSYGGRDEIIRAVKRLASDVTEKQVAVGDITEELFSSYLDTAGIPDVDLVIRTGGAENRRLSNFLPWQTVYSELYFSDLLWPEFSKEEFDRAIAYYNSVQRKLGK
ncbi:MAG: polyprenyl diphosphate synthase [Oscillospiraceae bacterium]|nr:polyprenyl diphosphate synthase [Oscillospiraceae bacterium]